MGDLSEPDIWDLDRLRLPADTAVQSVGRSRPPRHRSEDPFIKGPIPYAWIASACQLPGACLHVAMAFRFYRDRFRFKRRGLNWVSFAIRKGTTLGDHWAPPFPRAFSLAQMPFTLC